MLEIGWVPFACSEAACPVSSPRSTLTNSGFSLEVVLGFNAGLKQNAGGRVFIVQDTLSTQKFWRTASWISCSSSIKPCSSSLKNNADRKGYSQAIYNPMQEVTVLEQQILASHLQALLLYLKAKARGQLLPSCPAELFSSFFLLQTSFHRQTFFRQVSTGNQPMAPVRPSSSSFSGTHTHAPPRREAPGESPWREMDQLLLNIFLLHSDTRDFLGSDDYSWLQWLILPLYFWNILLNLARASPEQGCYTMKTAVKLNLNNTINKGISLLYNVL